MNDAMKGYDGKPLKVGDRVELHPGTDLWMQGARYGEIVSTSLTPQDRIKVRLDKVKGLFSGPGERFRKVESRFKVHTRSPRYFNTLAEACTYASAYEQRTGHVVAVT